MLTVDLPVAGRRERDVRAAFALPDDLPLPNLPQELRREDFHAALHAVVDDTLTWRDLEWLRSICPLPLVVKGILTAEDALLAAEHGAAAVVVSNHGGRQLDGVPPTLDVVPEVVEAVGERVEVLVDGGIRRGTDVLKALALGARATLSGRAVLCGPGGRRRGGRRAGARAAARARSSSGLKLLGCPSPAEVTRSPRAPGAPMIRPVGEGTLTTLRRPHARLRRARRRGRLAGDRLARHARQPLRAPSRPGAVRAPRRPRGRLRPARLRRLGPAARPVGRRRAGGHRRDRRRARFRALRRRRRLRRRTARARLRRAARRPRRSASARWSRRRRPTPRTSTSSRASPI